MPRGDPRPQLERASWQSTRDGVPTGTELAASTVANDVGPGATWAAPLERPAGR